MTLLLRRKNQLRAYPKADPVLVDVSTFVAGRQSKAAILRLRALRLTLTNSHFCTPLAHFRGTLALPADPRHRSTLDAGQ